MSDSYLQFWGKARPTSVDGPFWHPVAYHLLDVAATLEAILSARPVARRRASRLLSVSEDEAVRWMVVMAALHDLGKFARPFQAKCPELWPSALGSFDASAAIRRSHTDDGALVWMEHLREQLGERWPVPGDVDRPIMAAVFGHHGRPLQLEWGDWERYFGTGGLAAAEHCAADVVNLLGHPPSASSGLSGERARRASWWIAGMVSLADWVGSRQEWFPYRGGSAADMVDLPDYWTGAREHAGRAVAQAGLQGCTPGERRSFAALTGLNEDPTPMQRWAESVPLPEGPVLAIIEDVAGAGKTEAAQTLVHRLMVEKRASGAYWGMPSQATANAMYERQGKAIAALFGIGATPTLALAHGQAHLYQPLQEGVRQAAEAELAVELGDGEPPGSVSCTAFLADDRRAALLADVGAGTVDQALLAILPSRFNTVRLAGLADKVLVLDEVHAFDAYMGLEAARLLTFQAALGGSAVLLSATLPAAARRRLIEGWEEGLELHRPLRHPRLGDPDQPEVPLPSDYPLATVVSPAGREYPSNPIEPAAMSCRTVSMAAVHEFEEAGARVLSAAAAGGAVAWIRNTVDDCLRAAAWLREQGATPIVFHARFAQGDRQRREADVLAHFNKGSRTESRAGRIVVATQVIEQSLDLDFDALVTDLAPMDLLIQRVGRFRRHADRARPSGVPDEVAVFFPPLAETPPDDWLAGEFKGTAAVYDDPGILWRTARLLTEYRDMRIPDDLRGLVEGAYADGDLEGSLGRRSARASADRYGDAATAQVWALRLSDGYVGHFQGWLSETRVPTRLGDPRTTLRVARLVGERLVPWESQGPEWQRWALSEVRVSQWRVPRDVQAESRFRRPIAAARRDWGEYEREIPVLVLELAASGAWHGVLLTGEGRRVHIRYSSDDGLMWGAAADDDGGEAG